MKPQTIETPVGKFEIDNFLFSSPTGIDGELTFTIKCKRLPPENPMPNLKVGYQVRFQRINGDYYLVTQVRADSFLAAFNVCALGKETIFNYERIAEIYSPDSGLIWSRERRV